MAYWKIKDYGASGKHYECSNCGATYVYPFHRFISIKRYCPKCHEYINPKFEEYEWSLDYD